MNERQNRASDKAGWEENTERDLDALIYQIMLEHQVQFIRR